MAEVFVLARSIDSINSSATNTARTYDVGGFTRTFDDGFKREVFTTTVTGEIHPCGHWESCDAAARNRVDYQLGVLADRNGGLGRCRSAGQ